jgi:NhaP-type Na+/H+ or K+/H+ antiporter
MILGGLLLFFELASNYLKIRLYLSEPIIALLAGILFGPHLLDILNINSWGNSQVILEEVARLTLAVTLIGIAFRLPDRFVIKNLKVMAVLIGIVLPLMWLASGMLVYFLFDFPILIALLIGAVLAPTDPVVSSAIVTGESAEKNIPARLRHIISVESAANDALTYPFVMIPVLLLEFNASTAVEHLILSTFLWGTIGATVMGFILGWLSGKLLLWTEFHPDVERHSLVSITLSLALTALGMVKLLHMDGLLAVFVAGVTLNLVIESKMKPGPERIQEVVKRLIDLPIFFLFGMAIPWGKWLDLGWAAIIIPALILLLRRLPALLVTRRLVKQIKNIPDTLFAGWFGPIGVAAIYYATFSARKTGHDEVWIVASLVIFSSLVIFGITDMPFTLLYGKYLRTHYQENTNETVT